MLHSVAILNDEDADRETDKLYTQLLNAINREKVKWRDLNS